MNKKMALAGLCFVLFLLLIVVVSAVDVAPIGPEGTKVGLSKLNQAVHNALGTNFTLYKLTQLLGYFSILVAVGFAAIGLWQLIQRRSLKKVDQTIWALAVLYVLVGILYVLFEKFIVNYRPVIMPGEAAPEASFPSSHTMLFCVILGSAALAAGRYVQNKKTCRLIQLGCAGLSAVGVLCRLVSGVHWFTDILGGVLISAALLLLFSGVLEECDQ